MLDLAHRRKLGLTILESLIVLLVCVILAWVVVPIALVRMGWKEAGAMVVTEGDKAPVSKGPQLDPKVLKPRVEGVEVPQVIVPGAEKLKPPPSLPEKSPPN